MSFLAEDVTSRLSPLSVADTVSRLEQAIVGAGAKIFDVIDQRAEAQSAGLDLRDTQLVIFGSPRAGTAVMAAKPLAALDLPLKILVWDDEGKTTVSYISPGALAARYELSEELAKVLAALDRVTDAALAA